jgi:hypothetical protein
MRPTPTRTRPAPRRLPPFAAPLLALLLLGLAAGPAGAASLHVSLDDSNDITFAGGDVLIRTDGGEARISPDGDLFVDGRRVRVATRDREDLRSYNASMYWLKERAIDIGAQGVGLAAVALSEALVAIFTGDEKRVERRVEARADRLKDDARELCEEIRYLESLQHRLASRVAAFRPYAVIEIEANDCQVDG